MSRKKDTTNPKLRLSPTATVSHLTDALMEEMNIPPLPEHLPARLADAIRKRVGALLFALKEAKQQRYVRALEVRLVRDAYRAVLTAYELGLKDGEVYFARFRKLIEELGYVRTEIGFRKLEGED